MAWYTEYRDAVLDLREQGASVPEIAMGLDLSVEQVEMIFEKSRPKQPDQRSKDIFEMYQEGNTLATIGKKYGITRERVRQILQVQVAAELGIPKWRMKEFKEQINETMDMFVSEIRDGRQEEELKKKVEAAASKGIKPEYFSGLSAYCTAASISAIQLKQYMPEIYDSLKFVPGKRWSKNYAACRNCGTTSRKHRGMGLCEKCYHQSDYFKDIVKRSYQRNKEARSIQNKKFREEYMNRPDVREKLEKKYDEEYFGGNRKSALTRDNYRCLSCGMSTEAKDKLGRAKVRVWHVNGNANDNRLDNLKTYCMRCYHRIYGSPFRNRRQGQQR